MLLALKQIEALLIIYTFTEIVLEVSRIYILSF